MTISLLRNWICPKDITEVNPIFGRVDEEDATIGRYLVATFNLAQDFEGYLLMEIADLKEYRLFKGKNEAQDFILANWGP